MRYSTMISNGDASTYSAICDNVDYLVEKEECINHFSKQLGTRLRNLKNEYVTETLTKTGRTMKKGVLRGRGKLTDTTIQHFYMCFYSFIQTTNQIYACLFFISRRKTFKGNANTLYSANSYQIGISFGFCLFFPSTVKLDFLYLKNNRSQ